MATSIFHGAPGSFKSASAVWFELLPALRAGRLVVTNIEGIKPIEDIEQELNETFPETAKLWRMSSQSDTGHKLWRNWYHWVPCGALIIMDEVQDIYLTETTQFKPESCDYQPVQNYQEVLPEDWYQYHLDTLETYKPADLTSGDVDDLGIEIFNEHGHIIYPKTLKEAYMRHRKYNWDIICCTPDITSVHKYIRNVSQYAYAHKYFDGLAKIPYFYRRPRIHEHNPKLDGKTPNKADPKNGAKSPSKCTTSTNPQRPNLLQVPQERISFSVLCLPFRWLWSLFVLVTSAYISVVLLMLRKTRKQRQFLWKVIKRIALLFLIMTLFRLLLLQLFI
ncbi:zonular occludens toxin domain-containing protein [Pseudoalteromonas piscicida]|uniref:Zona occludens toxin n=1 Tax=Pseudoalteromonas piscicida TaxID=43662 RepID=A0ABN5CML5_PSEO7|nr:zonular occludens toxin domain-containing protein [Pseudoalteromonas piscicida]ATD10250.1 zona occludens toxin [Pseudoalteromonas piscicida]WPU32089.1 zonular occludens toxin domain-containing protein [Pseudoalteromonas piscicida]